MLLYVYMYVYKRVDISMMVMCNASVSGIDTIAYDRRTKELSNAALHMKHEIRCQQYRLILAV